MAPALIVLEGKLEIMGPNGSRKILVEDFFLGPSQTVLQDDEILIGIQIPRIEPDSRGTYLKLGARNSMEIAIVSVAVLLALDSKRSILKNLRVALGGLLQPRYGLWMWKKSLRARNPIKI